MIFGVIVVILIIIGGLFVLNNDKKEAAPADDAAAVEHGGDAMMEGEKMEGEGDSMMEDDKMEGEGDAMEAMTQTIALTGKSFAFSQNEIRVKKGEKVTITFESTDGFHDWVVDEFNAATERVSTGGKTEVTFTADKTGTFEYYCSVGNHRALGMKGNLIVE